MIGCPTARDAYAAAHGQYRPDQPMRAPVQSVGCQNGRFSRTASPATALLHLTRRQQPAQGFKSVADGYTEQRSQTTGLRFVLPRRARSLQTPALNLKPLCHWPEHHSYPMAIPKVVSGL